MDFGSILRKTRINAGLSQEAIAEKMLMPRSTISKLENDKMELKAKDLITWFRITNAPEIAAAILCGVDVAAVTQILSTFVAGVVKLGGWF